MKRPWFTSLLRWLSGLALAAGGAAASATTCTGKFPNPLTDIC